MMHSNPNFFYDILCYDSAKQNIHNPRQVGFTLNEPPVLLHDNIYSVKPYYLIDNNLNASVLRYSLQWRYEPDEIVFYPGMRLRTSGCISSFILYERPFTRIQPVIEKSKPITAQQRMPKTYVSTEQEIYANDINKPHKHNRVTIKFSNRHIEFICANDTLSNFNVVLTESEYEHGIRENDYLVSEAGPVGEVYYVKDVRKIQVDFKNGDRIIYDLVANGTKR